MKRTVVKNSVVKNSVVKSTTPGSETPFQALPVMVAYNGNHYESLIPIESRDCIRSIELVKATEGGPTTWDKATYQNCKARDN